MLEFLTTEARNPASESIDDLSALEIATLINSEDASIAVAVRGELGHIALAIEIIADRLKRGGRLIYFGSIRHRTRSWESSRVDIRP